MIRAYTSRDKSSLIDLLRKNTPRFFAPEEEGDFKSYLADELEDYFVYEEDARILGAGGFNYFINEKIARISWDMIDPEQQGKGIGKQLLKHRIQHIRGYIDVETIIVRTTQLVFRFYEKMGFELERIEKDYWAEGFDLYLMKMKNQK